MSDNAEEIQEPQTEGSSETTTVADPQPLVEENVPRETFTRERPENVPEKFWNQETGEIRTDELLKSNEHLEKFVGGKKDELREQIIDELSNEAIEEAPEEYVMPALPDGVTETDVAENPMFDWWSNHCAENAYTQEMFEDGVNTYINRYLDAQVDVDQEMSKLGENANARVDAVDSFASTYFTPDQYEHLTSTLGQTAEGIEILERVMEMQKQNISQVQTEPMNRLTLDDVRTMMKDPRYFDPRERDETFVKRVDDAFARLYR